MKISLRRALELAVGPANVDAAGHAVADWFDSIDWNATANRVREALRDQPGQPAPDAVPHDRPDTSLRAELLQKLATQREVLLNLCDRVDRLEMRADGLTPIERVERRWAKEAAGGDKLDRQADGPAVPDGREPASVVGEPSDELVAQWIAEVWHEGTPVRVAASDLHLASRAAEWGARWGHQPAPPVEGEVGELVAALRADAECIEAGSHDLCSITAEQLARAAELLQQRHAAPVPVSERLPVDVEQALIKAECALSDIAEGEPEGNGDSDDLLQWAEQCAATALSRIRPVMRGHGILTSEWLSLPATALPLPAGEA